MRFKCAACGEEHDIDKISFGAEAPLQWNHISEEDRARSILTPDQCELWSSEGRSYYIRACLEIPIRNTDQSFTWGVWCSLSEKSHNEVSEFWDDPKRVNLGPHFGWLCTVIPGYPDTAFLKTQVHQREVGTRPWVELEATDHPLSVDQREGIEMERLREMIVRILHEA